MKNKSMTPFWIVGPLTAIFNLIGIMAMYIPIFTSIVAGADFTEVSAILLTGGSMILVFLVPIVSLVSSIMGIVHLVFFATNRFINNDAKVVHALYQMFFGVGLIGLIVVLVVNPPQSNKTNIDND